MKYNIYMGAEQLIKGYDDGGDYFADDMYNRYFGDEDCEEWYLFAEIDEETNDYIKVITLCDIIDSQGYNVDSFVRKFNIPESTVRNIINRGIENSSIKVVHDIAHALNMAADELYEILKK